MLQLNIDSCKCLFIWEEHLSGRKSSQQLMSTLLQYTIPCKFQQQCQCWKAATSPDCGLLKWQATIVHSDHMMGGVD